MNDPSHTSDRNLGPADGARDAPCLLGLIGRGILRSKSRALHETEAAAHGIRCTYELIDLDERGIGLDRLADLLNEAERKGFAGLNITHPCKQAVIPLLHELSPEAQAIGAVNTVRFHAHRRMGYNTDAWGFGEGFRRGLGGVSVERVVQVGAGGAGAATGFALLELGARQLIIVDVDYGRARSLAASLALRFGDRDVQAGRALEDVMAAADGVVNSTPVGMAQHPGSAVPFGLLRPEQWVADVVYVPLETELLRAARRIGCRTLDGGKMVVFQAARAFEIFTGHVVDTERMLHHFEKISRI
jgi:shikimate dehydrogenase